MDHIEVINPDDYRIERSGGKVRCITKTGKDTEVILWETTEDFIEYPEFEYNQPVPKKIDTSHRVKHYNDFDTTELYKSYAHIMKMIERMDKQAKDPRAARTMNDYHNKWGMNELRTYCQIWLDDVRFRQDGDSDRWWVWDRIKYFFKGKLKQRIWWLQAFGTICYDMCARLDAIDGGNEAQQATQIVPQQHRIGFN